MKYENLNIRSMRKYTRREIKESLILISQFQENKKM
jgi:hypothetical protein